MLKRIIDITGSLTLTFYLLAGVILTFGIGAIYASLDYSFFENMNTMRIQVWFRLFGLGSPHKSWWIIALFFFFSVLGLNVVVCALRRITDIWSVRKNYSMKGFMVLFSPTLIHLVFIAMLSGHLLTFTGIEMQNIPIDEGSGLSLPDGTQVKIEKIKHYYFDESSLLKDRVRQTDVTASYPHAGESKKVLINFLKPAFLNGYRLHLDMKKIRIPDQPVVKNPLDETCNKERHFKKEEQRSVEKPQISVIVTFDPGIYVIIPGFAAVILLLLFYFYNVYTVKN